MNRPPVLSTRDVPLSLGVVVLVTVLLLLHTSAGAQATAFAGTAVVRTGRRADSTPVAPGTAQVTWPRATRALPRGETLGAGDFTLADTVIAWHWNRVQPDSTRAVIGWVTRRAIAAGEFLRSPSIAPANVVTAGTTVTVLWNDGTLRLTLKGTATNNAALGAPVGVRIDRNRRLDGLAVAPNTVRLR